MSNNDILNTPNFFTQIHNDYFEYDMLDIQRVTLLWQENTKSSIIHYKIAYLSELYKSYILDKGI